MAYRNNIQQKLNVPDKIQESKNSAFKPLKLQPTEISFKI